MLFPSAFLCSLLFSFSTFNKYQEFPPFKRSLLQNRDILWESLLFNFFVILPKKKLWFLIIGKWWKWKIQKRCHFVSSTKEALVFPPKFPLPPSLLPSTHVSSLSSTHLLRRLHFFRAAIGEKSGSCGAPSAITGCGIVPFFLEAGVGLLRFLIYLRGGGQGKNKRREEEASKVIFDEP